jgi:hypothetical protein
MTAGAPASGSRLKSGHFANVQTNKKHPTQRLSTVQGSRLDICGNFADIPHLNHQTPMKLAKKPLWTFRTFRTFTRMSGKSARRDMRTFWTGHLLSLRRCPKCPMSARTAPSSATTSLKRSASKTRRHRLTGGEATADPTAKREKTLPAIRCRRTRINVCARFGNTGVSRVLVGLSRWLSPSTSIDIAAFSVSSNPLPPAWCPVSPCRGRRFGRNMAGMESTIEKQPIAADDEQRGSPADRLRPYRWVKGQSGNPKGRRTTPQRIAERYEVLAGEFAAPTPVERLMLHEAAKLLVRAERSGDPDICVRTLGCVRRLLDGLRQRRVEDAPPPPRPPLPWSPARERYGLCEPAKESDAD